jgi:hypothetical protein
MDATHEALPDGKRPRSKGFRRKWAVYLGLVMIFTACLGYLSNFINQSKCESHAARWLTKGFQDATNVYCFAWSSRVSPHDLFSERTSVTIENGSEDEGGSDVSISVQAADKRIPFFVAVNWTWATGPLRGASGQCSYLNFFWWHRAIGCEAKQHF